MSTVDQLIRRAPRRRARQRTDSSAFFAEQAPVDRGALRERDHDVLSALVAVEGGLRALRAGTAVKVDEGLIALIDAIAIEVSTARRLLSPDRGPIPEAFDLTTLLRTIAHGERARGATLQVSVAEGLHVRGCASRTAEILRNLLDNARLHAPGAAVYLCAEREGSWVDVYVSDDGPGIAPDERARIFDAGVRGSHAAAGGSGLGLHLAAELAQALGGTLTLDVGVSGGAALRLRLPTAVSP